MSDASGHAVHRSRRTRNTRWSRAAVWISCVAIVGAVAVAPCRAAEPGDARATIAAHERHTPPISGELIVLAAASLTAPFQEIAKSFEAHHPGLSVRVSFAGSPTLVQQIEQGAPADVFASADMANMQRLIVGEHIDGSPRVFARNTLEIVVPADNPKQIASLADLLKPGLIIALAGPTVPAGRYAAEAFTKAGLTPPAASQEPDVKAVLNKVALGEADAGIVYTTDLRTAGDTVRGVAIPAAHNVVAQYPTAVVKGAGHRAAAQQFADWVLSEPGQSVLRRFGFLAP